MFMLLNANAFATACDVQWLSIHDLEVGLWHGEKMLPTHTLLSVFDTPCAAGQQMEVIGLPSYSKALKGPLVQPGDRLCLKLDKVSLPSGLVVYAHEEIPQWSMRSGDLKPFDASMSCDIKQIGQGQMSLLTAANGQAVTALQQHWQTVFGTDFLGQVEINPWGYVALPHGQILTVSDAAAADAKEHLDTPSRKEKGIRAIGPNQAWLHFWGADQPYSDHWAPPDRIREWVDLAVSWTQSCLEQKLGSPTQCALKIGDIAWLNPKLPDPLGHKTHYQGACMDIRLFRNDDSTYEAYWNRTDDRPQAVGGYSQTLTQAFVDYVHSNTTVDVFYFNDTNVKGVQVSRGHDDHLHLCLK